MGRWTVCRALVARPSNQSRDPSWPTRSKRDPTLVKKNQKPVPPATNHRSEKQHDWPQSQAALPKPEGHFLGINERRVSAPGKCLLKQEKTGIDAARPKLRNLRNIPLVVQLRPHETQVNSP